MTSERQRIVADDAAGIADHVRVALGQTGVLGRVQAGVHAGDHGKATPWRHRQVALVEARRIAAVGLEDLIDGSPWVSPPRFTF
jgi:hypothetical protein